KALGPPLEEGVKLLVPRFNVKSKIRNSLKKVERLRQHDAVPVDHPLPAVDPRPVHMGERDNKEPLPSQPFLNLLERGSFLRREPRDRGRKKSADHADESEEFPSFHRWPFPC